MAMIAIVFCVHKIDRSQQHMSPKTMAALPKSPAGARRSSSGGGLRPVLPFGLDDVELGDVEDDAELGPMPRESGPFGSGGGVDEVEYAYGSVLKTVNLHAYRLAHPSSVVCDRKNPRVIF